MSTRMLNGFGLLLCLFLICAAAYFQFVLGFEPCPLCIVQRLFILLVGLIFLVAVLHNPGKRGTRIYALVTLLSVSAGAYFSIRQIYLQLSPPDTSAFCLPNFTYMIKTLPLTESLRLMLTGSGNCGQVVWKYLGLTIPMWTLVFFIVLALLTITQLICSKLR